MRGDRNIPARRIIPCLDVRDGKVVKGIRFRHHRVVGDIVSLAERYCRDGADELVFYDITASAHGRTVDRKWVSEVAARIDVPFCVAGGVRSIADAEEILRHGADKVSVNSPALEDPSLVSRLAARFGTQCVVVGIDSLRAGNTWRVCQYTGDAKRMTTTSRVTEAWVRQVQDLGAGEIVLNCMSQDGVRNGYDIEQLATVRECCDVPLVASGGAGNMQDFEEVLTGASVSAALAASVFHLGVIGIPELKRFLHAAGVEVRL